MNEEELKTLIFLVKSKLLVNETMDCNNKKILKQCRNNIVDIFNKPIKDYINDEDKLFILDYLINNKNNNGLSLDNEILFDTLISELNFNVGDIILYTLDRNSNRYFLNKLNFFKKYISMLDKIQLNELLVKSIRYGTSEELNEYLVSLGADRGILSKRIKNNTTNEDKFSKLFREKSSKSCSRDRVLIKYLLKELGHPEKKIKNVIHITGSNGKGSTCHFLKYILEANGYSVNVYTNPSVVHYSENYYVAGKNITDEKYDSLMLKVKEAYDRVILNDEYKKSVKIADENDLKHGKDIHNPQYDNVLIWSFVVVIMILAFSESNADFSIIEVRNGGLNDVTNVFSENEVIATVLTYIQYGIGSNDGTMPIYNENGKAEYSNRATAYHKAMLGRKNRPMILANQTLDVLEEIRRVAKEEVKSYTVEYGREWFIKNETKNSFVFSGFCKKLKINKSKTLLGNFQTKNIATALATLYTLQQQGKVKINDELIQQGVDKTKIAGRLAKITKGNYVDYFDDKRIEIITGFIKFNKGGVDDFIDLFTGSSKGDNYTYIIYTANAKKVLKDDIFLFEKLKSMDDKKFKLVIYKKDKEVFEYIKEQLKKNNLDYTLKINLSSALKYVKEDIGNKFGCKDKRNADKNSNKKIKLFIVCDAMTKFDSNIDYMS